MKVPASSTKVIISFCVFFCVGDVTAQTDVESIVSKMNARVQALFTETHEFSLSYSRYETETIVHGTMATGQLNVAWKIAKRGADWAIQRSFIDAIDAEKVRVTKKPLYLVLKDKELFEWNSNLGSASVGTMDRLNNVANHFDYFKFAGFNAPRRIVLDSGNSWESAKSTLRGSNDWPWLPSAVGENVSNYSFESGENGTVVLKSGSDEIVLDPARGYAVTGRVLRSSSNQKIEELFASDFREVKAGLWLPFELERHIFGVPQVDRDKLIGKKVAISRYRIDDFSFAVDPKVFEPSLPSEIVVADRIRGITYEVAGEFDPFAGHLDKSKEVLATTKSTSWYWYLAVILGAFVALAAVGWIKRRGG